MNDVKKVVLAYSGGLDTSIILKWLQQTYNCEVVTFTADIGQGGEELEPARAKAEKERLEAEEAEAVWLACVLPCLSSRRKVCTGGVWSFSCLATGGQGC